MIPPRFWVAPCETKVDDFGIKINGEYYYAYKQYLLQPLGDGICFGGVQGFSPPDSQYDEGDIIGQPVIVGNYIVFDGIKQQLGFAHKAVP